MREVDNFFSKLIHLMMLRKSVFVMQQTPQGTTRRRLHPKLEFIIAFIRRVLSSKEKCLYAHELLHTVEKIRQLAQQFQTHPSELHKVLVSLINDIRIATINAEREREERKHLLRKNVPGDGDPDEHDIEFVKQMIHIEEISQNKTIQQKQNIKRLFDEWMNYMFTR